MAQEIAYFVYHDDAVRELTRRTTPDDPNMMHRIQTACWHQSRWFERDGQRFYHRVTSIAVTDYVAKVRSRDT